MKKDMEGIFVVDAIKDIDEPLSKKDFLKVLAEIPKGYTTEEFRKMRNYENSHPQLSNEELEELMSHDLYRGVGVENLLGEKQIKQLGIN